MESIVMSRNQVSIISVLVVTLFTNTSGLGQHVTITVRGMNSGVAVLSKVCGEKLITVDSTMPNSAGKFEFRMEGEATSGMYRVLLGSHTPIEFIQDGVEDIEIVEEADSVRLVGSEGNQKLYAFRKANQQYKSKADILQFVLDRYPQNAPYYQTTQQELTELARSYRNFVQSLTITTPSSFASRYIASAQLPVVDYSIPPDAQRFYFKAYALDRVDFADEALINSDLFAMKSIEYLSYYRNPQLPKEMLASEFTIAIDTLLKKAKVNDAVYQHIVQYLIDGFRQYGFEDCVNYVLDNYVVRDNLCLDRSSDDTVQRMIDQRKYLPLGSRAPEITLPDTAGNRVSLSNLSTEKALVVFYSVSCPHCKLLLPKLSGLGRREHRRSLEILAVSIDNNVDAWLNFIKSNSLSTLHAIDTSGWNGKAASDYYVYATPTMLLLNKEKEIIGKPLTIEELLPMLD